MATEIERKFLVTNEDWRLSADAGTRFLQGYLNEEGRASVRVRIEGECANLNIKSADAGIQRQEYEYSIPLDDARRMLADLCVGGLIEKTRFRVRHGGHLWEVDVFAGANAGLVVAELELDAVAEFFERPAWLGEEVSHDARYYNHFLARRPWKDW
ncbi:MAG: CYTH domain-containing protein [Gammaproteobacteria bacterium]